MPETFRSSRRWTFEKTFILTKSKPPTLHWIEDAKFPAPLQFDWQKACINWEMVPDGNSYFASILICIVVRMLSLSVLLEFVSTVLLGNQIKLGLPKKGTPSIGSLYSYRISWN